MNLKSEQLGKRSIKQLLISLSLPASIAMMVNGLYNVIDAIFIGQGVGELALGGLAIAFPIQMLIMGFAQMVGIGAASFVSRNLGANKVDEADHVAGNAYTATVILSSLFMVFGLVFVDELLYVFGATKDILPYATDYIVVILSGSVFFSLAMMSNSLIRAEGNAKIAMISMLVGAILNIILDPIFIFIFDMGIRGAAFATIISQFISFIFVMGYLNSGKSTLKIKFHHLKPKFTIIWSIFTVGFSALARSSTSSIFAIVVNNSLRIFGGNTAIIIFGIVNRVIAFLFMPIIGIGQGMQPIVGYNYGAKKLARVKEAIKLSLMISTTIAVLGWIIGETIPHLIIRVFTDDQELIKEGSMVFRIVIAMIPLLGIQFIGATLFQALGKGIPALILSLLRQFLLLVPLILIIPRLFNLDLLGVWIAFPIADVIATLITAYLLNREVSKINHILEQEDNLLID